MAWYSYISDLEVCPLDPAHRVEKGRKFQLHLIKCQMNYPHIRLSHCPFNYSHLVKERDLDAHMARCPNSNTKTFPPPAGLAYSRNNAENRAVETVDRRRYRRSEYKSVPVVICDDDHIINSDSLSGLKRSVKRRLRQEIRPGIVIESDSKDYVVSSKRPAINLSPLRTEEYKPEVLDDIGYASADSPEEEWSPVRCVSPQENEVIILDDSDDDHEAVTSKKYSPIEKPIKEREITVTDDSDYAVNDDNSEISSIHETEWDTDGEMSVKNSVGDASFRSKTNYTASSTTASRFQAPSVDDITDIDDDILIIETEMDMLELTGDFSSTTREFSSLSLNMR